MKKIGLFLFASVLLVVSGFTHAQAETVACTVIDSLPYTVTTQGVYCLTGHLNTGITTGNAITINTNNVVLDLNGFKIGGLAAGTGTLADGIYAFQRQNITIKNGTVRGFRVGIYLADFSPYTTSQGHLIEDIRADQNTAVGLWITGKGNTIRNNIVVATGGTTAYGANVENLGMSFAGPGAQVLNNTVTEVTAKGNGVGIGIYLSSSNNSVVMSNRISTVTSPSGSAAGIYLSSSSDILVSDNRISGTQYGIWFYSVTSGSYMNNLVRSSGTAYIGGSPAGTTNY